MNKLFKFKEFSVNQDRCAMKIGTDSVLLGAWTSVEFQIDSILDIGSGTGVLALILAQRSSARTIDALEIDDGAYQQCVENFEDSPWADRLFCYHASLDEFTNEIDDKYDLIICNPPFFETPLNLSEKDLGESRAKARFFNSLSFESLMESASFLLKKVGILSVVVPYDQQERLLLLAKNFGLFPNRILNVRGTESSDLKRTLIEFGSNSIQPDVKEMVIEKERHLYTEEYVNLTKDFYMNM